MCTIAHRLAAARPAAGGDAGMRSSMRSRGRSPILRRCACAGGNHGITRLPAAGMPWFMTVFGRDTLITSYQTLLFGPELARGALEVLAELQATEDDPSIDAEPGKIVHEVRHGKAAKVWFPRYYGTVDATPLYLVLLSEVWRWTRDTALVARLREPALRALEWIDEHGDSTATASSSTERRTERGLENQSWKDSGDSQRFADGRLADAADRARARCRGTSTTRSCGRPSSPARSGTIRSWPSGSRPRPPSCSSASTRRSGSTSAAGTTRSRSTPTKRAGRLALLEHRAPALERDRPGRSGSSRWSPR